MALVFKVGEHEDMSPVPRNFPKCGDWKSMDDQMEFSSEESVIDTTIEKASEKERYLDNKIEQFLKSMEYFEQLFESRASFALSFTPSIELTVFALSVISFVQMCLL